MPYHEGAKLTALVEWINRRRERPFRTCDVILADSLQRHNAPASVDPQVAHARANDTGAAWLARNAPALEQLEVPWEVRRWDELLGHPNYPARRAALEALCERSPKVADAIDAETHAFVDRAAARGATIADRAAAIRTSREYFLEELAVDAAVAEERPAADLYPGSMPTVYDLLAHGDIPGTPPGLRASALALVRVRFRPRRDAVGASARS